MLSRLISSIWKFQIPFAESILVADCACEFLLAAHLKHSDPSLEAEKINFEINMSTSEKWQVSYILLHSNRNTANNVCRMVHISIE
jgi:hypothetical protein